MKNSILLIPLIMFFIQCKKVEKRQAGQSIQVNYQKIDIDKNWQSVSFKDGDILYCPVKWKKSDNEMHSITFDIANNTYFFFDVIDGFTGNKFEEEIIKSVKDLKLQENRIARMSFKNSNSKLYYYKVLGSKSEKYEDITNFFVTEDKAYRFTIISDKNLNSKYIDTLNIITNTYSLKDKTRLIPFNNGYENVDFIEK